MSYLQLLKVAMPETIVVITVLAVLAADLLALRGVELKFRRIISGMIACVGCLGAIAWIVITPEKAEALGGMLVVDPLTQFVKVAVLVLTVFHGAAVDRFGFHDAHGRISRARSAGGFRHDVPGERGRRADDFHRARADQLVVVHPHGI